MNRTCACCGGIAPSANQWWNQDTGYSICQRCWVSNTALLGIEHAVFCYGFPGVHHTGTPFPGPLLMLHGCVGDIKEEAKVLSYHQTWNKPRKQTNEKMQPAT